MNEPFSPKAEIGETVPERQSSRSDPAVEARIARAVSRARLALFFEALWPRLLPLLLLLAAFLAVSWFGLWRVTPDVARFVLLGAFGVAGLLALVFVARVRIPDAAAGLGRVERATGEPHRPATAFRDKLVSAPDEPAARALWTAHRRRILASLDRLKAGWPVPGVARLDPFAFRFLVVLILAVAFVFAGRERFERVAEAFQGATPDAVIAARIDAWVTPPAYTGRPPVFLTGERSRALDSVVRLPEGSVLTVRVAGRADIAVSHANSSGETEIAPTAPEEKALTRAAPGVADQAAPTEYRVKLSTSGTVSVKRHASDLYNWRFTVDPDTAPSIAFQGTPAPTTSGALRLAYTLSDDYGVTQAEAVVEALAAKSGKEARPLYPAPKIPLSLPHARTRSGTGETVRSLSADPWAGGPVRMRLVARDETGQTGQSEPIELTLPARVFTDPFARALVEQRRNLALDANQAYAVAGALDALTIAPEKYIEDLGVFLSIRSVYHRLTLARDDDDLRSVADELWNIALGIEEGDLSDVARELRAAQEALRQALENNASDEELKRLTDQLRAAMQRFMQALAEQSRKNPNASRLPMPPNSRVLRPQDLERMLDQIERLAQTGSRDAARQMLSELQNMLESLQAGRPQPNQQMGQMGEMLNELGDMIRRQQELMDQTYRLNRGQRPDEPGAKGDGPPMTPEELADALRQLQEGQQSLQEQLQELMGQLEGMGMGENGQLGRADQSMGQAAGNLGQGEPGSAVGNQGNALEALRQGAQSLSEQMANRGMRPGPGQNGQVRQGMRGGDDGTDPLGRPYRNPGPDLGTQVKVPDEIDTQRAREILDTIRKRLGESARPLLGARLSGAAAAAVLSRFFWMYRSGFAAILALDPGSRGTASPCAVRMSGEGLAGERCGETVPPHPAPKFAALTSRVPSPHGRETATACTTRIFSPRSRRHRAVRGRRGRRPCHSRRRNNRDNRSRHAPLPRRRSACRVCREAPRC